VFHLADCRSWCSCGWLRGKAITNYQQTACTKLPELDMLLVLLTAQIPLHNTQQWQSSHIQYHLVQVSFSVPIAIGIPNKITKPEK
jgi:hypothetical protein